jgi:monovalent cation:H+ antiporter-2, CPA2 family
MEISIPMHQSALLVDIILILGFGLVCGLLASRLRQPALVGYILAGLLIGPHGLGLVAHVELEFIAELGVVLLLFNLGIELSFDRIKRIRTIALGGGSLQVGLIVLLGVLTAYLLDWTLYRGVYLGCLVALSSSAIVLKLLQESGEIDTLHGRISLGILLFQDLALVPMMIVLPVLANPQGSLIVPLALAAVKATAFLAAAVLASRYVLPVLFRQTATSGSRELFLLLVLVLVLGTAWVSHAAGLSLALGAFIAGIVVSDSRYSLRILSDVLPFKDIFLCVFFVSVGMLLDPGFVLDHPDILGIVVLLVLLVKFVVCTGVVVAFRYPLRAAIVVGATLSQIGEFSFVLATMGLSLGLIGDYLYQLTLAGTVITMVLTPQIMRLGKMNLGWLLRMGVPERWLHGRAPQTEDGLATAGHVIICGFGPVGQRVAQVLAEHDLPYLVLELNASRVKELQQSGVPAYYGDSASLEVLLHAGLQGARALAVTYADPAAARRTVAQARTVRSDVHVSARTRLPQDIAELHRLGADSVIEEEFEVSLEMASQVLEALGASRIALDSERAAIRESDYDLFTDAEVDHAPLQDLIRTFPDVDVRQCLVSADSVLAGKTLSESRMRSEMGVTVLSMVRADGPPDLPASTYRISVGDRLTLMGEQAAVRKAIEILTGKSPT